MEAKTGLTMRTSKETTAIYLVCFHSEKPKSLDGTEGQFRKVEAAIRDNEWPYDNGDDPSFYVSMRGGRLTWGVCRQDLRNAITKGSIVVFFSFTTLKNSEILYRLCAVATVEDKVDHRAIHRDRRLTQYCKIYINGLIAPENEDWRYNENDRQPQQRHKDWFWRMADHRRIKKDKFDKEYANIYSDCWFSDSAVCKNSLLAANYLIFSAEPDRGFISPNPPEVARAVKGQHEKWTDLKLRAMTVGTAGAFLSNKRDYLRAAKRSGGYVHRHIRFEMLTDDACIWRKEMIELLGDAAAGRSRTSANRERADGSAKC